MQVTKLRVFNFRGTLFSREFNFARTAKISDNKVHNVTDIILQTKVKKYAHFGHAFYHNNPT